MKLYLSFKRIYRYFWFSVANLPMPRHGIRPFFCKMAGVQIMDWKNTFIGRNVSFDKVHPELCVIETGVRITEGVSILTHYINPSTGVFDKGTVVIKKGAFIGTKTIITKPITIGEGSVIGGGSVITKNIPDYEVWAGNPAHFMKKI